MRKGVLFDIQRYAVHDGPGIRTAVFFKGCPLACRWCCNPESQVFGPELRHLGARCRSCFACKAACPEQAIGMTVDGPIFTRSACAMCADWRCVEACPRSALAKVGEAISSDEVLTQIAADEAFYRNSGGGATFSGGEPFAQPDFLEALLAGCRSQGIHTAVETCGYVPKDTLMRLAPLVDLFLYDLKVVDTDAHSALTGRSNGVILANLRALAARAPDKIVLRVPLVPGCTDSPENLRAIAGIASELRLPAVELMPYHELGRDKYAQIGRECAPCIEAERQVPDCAEALGIFAAQGVPCVVNGW